MKKLLILGTSHGVLETIKYAKKNGIYTIVSDYFPPEKSYGKQFSDEYWMVSTADVDTLEKMCHENNIDGITTGTSEYSLGIMMELCKRLNLQIYCTPETWHYSVDKADFKKVCRANNVPLATDYYLSKELTDDEVKDVKFPVVVKPVDLCGNRGISFCNNVDELRSAYKYALSMSKSDKIVVERKLEGEEWYSFYAMADGKISLIALNAMFSEPGYPKNCYTITTTVSDNIERYVQEINPGIEKVLQEIGCKEGICWVQAMLDKDNHFYVLEMGYRYDGDMMFVPYKEVCNFDAIEWMVNYALGGKNDPAKLPKPQLHAFTKCGCSYMLWCKKDAIIKEIRGLDEIQKIPGVSIDMVAGPGDKATQYRPVGDVLFATNNCDEMCDIIDKINNIVQVIDENGNDIVIKYTQFDYLKSIYKKGLDEANQ